HDQLHSSPRPPPGNRAVGGGVVISAETATKPVRAVGGFFAITLDTFVLMFKPPFAWREYLSQCWFVARVSTLPAVLMTIPWAVISGFLFNVLLADIGAADFSGTGAGSFAVFRGG